VYLFELYTALSGSTDPTLAAIAAKSVKEVEYHRDHAVQWTLRLGGGTEESRRRMVRALGDVWPYVEELFRDEPQFRSAWLFEQPNGDFAQTIARQLAASVYWFELYSALQGSADPTLAAVAAKAVKEVEYHRDHAVQWTLRLAGGTDESRRRMLRAVADVWPYVDELFRDEPLTDALAASGIAVRPSALRAVFDAVIAAVFEEAEIAVPAGFVSSGGGRHGSHAATLGFLLAEMQVLARQHPGATW
jgi:ring-1,2-phenylacetyl-CoA epoxidase subunit PaaC